MDLFCMNSRKLRNYEYKDRSPYRDGWDENQSLQQWTWWHIRHRRLRGEILWMRGTTLRVKNGSWMPKRFQSNKTLRLRINVTLRITASRRVHLWKSMSLLETREHFWAILRNAVIEIRLTVNTTKYTQFLVFYNSTLLFLLHVSLV